jgi:hypothetical protein
MAGESILQILSVVKTQITQRAPTGWVLAVTTIRGRWRLALVGLN